MNSTEFIHQCPSLKRADAWSNLSGAFMQLADEEEQTVRATRKDSLLRAYCDYKKHPEIFAERGKPDQGCFCLLKVPETGLWMISDGISENFQARFRALAARSGVVLGCTENTDPEDFWLHRLYANLLENKSDQLFAASKDGGIILRACVASATFCSRLETSAFEESTGYGVKDSVTPTLKQAEPPVESKETVQANGDAEEKSAPTKIPEQFTHSEDFRCVTVRGKTYSLTFRQAQVIEILLNAHANGMPDVSIASVLERLETPNSRWQDTFKSNFDAKKALIASGARKGTLRLNL